MTQLPYLQLDQALEKGHTQDGGSGVGAEQLHKAVRSSIQVGKLAWYLFADKVLLEHNYIRLFTYCLRLLLCCKSGDLSIQNIYCLVL